MRKATVPRVFQLYPRESMTILSVTSSARRIVFLDTGRRYRHALVATLRSQSRKAGCRFQGLPPITLAEMAPQTLRKQAKGLVVNKKTAIFSPIMLFTQVSNGGLPKFSAQFKQHSTTLFAHLPFESYRFFLRFNATVCICGLPIDQSVSLVKRRVGS